MLPVRGRRYIVLAFVMASITILLVISDSPRRTQVKEYFENYLDLTTDVDEVAEKNKRPHPEYLPTPTWVPPPVKDPFPLLSTSTPPLIPEWNVPKKDLHKRYNIDYAPPLFIGFTRTWPVLLQAVVSYITAGWPADQIYVIENTGVQRANLEGKLTLQNPYYLNYVQLKMLGVNVIRTPVLMNFAQLQNFYIHLAHENHWPYYFWSHMDVLVLSYEDGNEHTPPATHPDYKTVYELSLAELNRTLHTDDHWADRFFSYDHLTLVNRASYDEVGGWDTFIPYYMTDCDMHSRLIMHNWTQRDGRAGIITDVSTVMDDLLVLYRDPSLEPSFTDPNPPPPTIKDEKIEKRDNAARNDEKPELVYWRKLQNTANAMFHYKHGNRDRNTWQVGQKGGQGEPYYYDPRGIGESINVLTEAGREIYRRKWGHRDCDLIEGAGLKLEDQWLVAKDWS